MCDKRWIGLLFILGMAISGVTGCSTTGAHSSAVDISETGYFLSMKQKGQLIGQGRIQDASGNWYDVWIVPGYAQPAQRSRKYFRMAGSDFAEYGQPQKYRSLARHSKNAFVWAYDDCLLGFTIKGVPSGWRRSFSEARDRTERRVFGWWFAYPWAAMEITAETAARLALGTVGTVGGTAWGVAVVPAYHMLDSAVVGTWHLAVDAMLFPAVGITWNTVIAPPLALVGQKPAPERVDGFWVTQLKQADIDREAISSVRPKKETVEDIARWGELLLAETRTYDERRKELRNQMQVEIDAIRKREQQESSSIAAEERAHVLGLTDVLLQSGTVDQAWLSGVSKLLTERGDLSRGDVTRIMDLLRKYPPPESVIRPEIREKTDPLQRSIEVILEGE